jgi:glycine betaine/proline transport system ATP-binding protein
VIHLEHIYKLWGPKPHTGIELLKQGWAKAELLAERGLVVGLNDINLQIERGELFVIMGLSGSGKSTLIRTLNRLVEPTDGKIWIDEQDITAMSKRDLRMLRGRRISMVFQNFALFPHRTVLENTVFGLEVQGVPEQERNDAGLEALALVGLEGWEEYLPDQLSGGMQQRVGLARALATDSDILLMDEAFSALDPLIRKGMQSELLRLQRKLHKTIVFITHDLDEALAIGDRIAILRGGQLLQIGTPEEIVLNPADDHVATFVQGVNLLNVLTASRIAVPLDGLEPPLLPTVGGHHCMSAGLGQLLLLDEARHPIGLIDENHSAPSAHIAIDAIQPVATVSGETLLRDLLRGGRDTFPVVVTGKDGEALGVIRARSIVEAFSIWEERTSEIMMEEAVNAR